MDKSFKRNVRRVLEDAVYHHRKYQERNISTQLFYEKSIDPLQTAQIYAQTMQQNKFFHRSSIDKEMQNAIFVNSQGLVVNYLHN